MHANIIGSVCYIIPCHNCDIKDEGNNKFDFELQHFCVRYILKGKIIMKKVMD